MLDTIETLFGGLLQQAILRAELRRLFRWLKDKGVTAIITAERGDGTLTRQGLEEYVSDCVILLDHRVTEQVSTRRLRVVKYRGSAHGTNEYPFLIDEEGFSVLPVTSIGPGPRGVQRADLDRDRAARRHAGRRGLLPRQQRPHQRDGGDRQEQPGRPLRRRRLRAAASAACISPSRNRESQIVRNMASIGIDLRAVDQEGAASHSVAARPTATGLETHLAADAQAWSRSFQPRMVIVDPITNLARSGTAVRSRGRC